MEKQEKSIQVGILKLKEVGEGQNLRLKSINYILVLYINVKTISLKNIQ